MKYLILISFFLTTNLSAEEYRFAGKHFLTSFYECDPKALTDLDHLRQAMNEAIELSGATILSSSDHVFLPNGLTMVWLLSESHASIHTYPEHNACFIDLFTCGHKCSHEKFEHLIKKYLRPKSTQNLVLTRD
jgi:S-adenosylmethionine decarboxylase